MSDTVAVKVSAELSPELLETLKRLAERRGVSVNTVLQQAIETEKFFTDAMDAGGKVLIEKRDKSFRQILFDKKAK